MFQFLTSVLFPKTCLSCRREGAHLCEDCFAFVSIANTPSPLSSHSPLSGLFCATSYQDQLIRKAIHRFKYKPYLKDLAFPLASLIIAHLSFIDKPSLYPKTVEDPSYIQNNRAPKDFSYVLCPVPLHKRRLKARGFNHAEEIAKVLSSALGVPAVSPLARIRHTAPQVELKEQERKQNVAGAFRVANSEAVANKKILLVDDVFTTGATMEECAGVLRRAGAKRVWGVVVARG